MNWHELLLLPENLLWAWRKARNCYRMADGLYDQAALAEFELNLETELESIRAGFASWTYACSPLRLVPQPKKPDKDGKPRFRQYFQLAVRDQVAWIALANVLGPEMDKKMPAWSYGNRLYRAAWYEEASPEDPHSKLNIGPYRHAAGNLYRHFKHSWPLYRRHISLTARRMVNAEIEPDQLDTGERLALKQTEGLAYLGPTYWSKPSGVLDTIYAASLDLSKFYPSIRKDAILNSFATFLPGFSEELGKLIDQMLSFTVDISGVGKETLSEVVPLVTGGTFERIPTGIFVGGFLANVAMLPVDVEVEGRIITRRNIAHFRFVDDHTVLAYDFETLLNWLSDYSDMLQQHNTGAEIEPDKYIPSGLKQLVGSERRLNSDEDLVKILTRVASEAAVNGRKPVELMTRTLAQVSMLAAQDFDLLTDAGRGQRLDQLEWLLLANIPDQEIRSDTRMAFAAAQIAALTPSLFRPNDDLLFVRREIAALAKRKPDLETENRIVELKRQEGEFAAEESRNWLILLQRHFSLLFEAFVTYPDKVRLFTRMIDFCRTTGYNGFPLITGWIKENQQGGAKLLKCYLGATALNVIARHLLTASTTLVRLDVLHRERAAASSFIKYVLAAELDRFVPTDRRGVELQFFQWDALTAFTAALVIGSREIRETDPKLSHGMSQRAGRMGLGEQAKDVDGLAKATGVNIGIWYHWFFSRTGAYNDRAPAYWTEVADVHLPAELPDWTSLRRYPALLPQAAWEQLEGTPDLLSPDDAGWLLDAARAAPDRFRALSGEGSAVEAVQRRLSTSRGLSLTDWVKFVSTLERSDPRRSEWTSLEVMRQIMESLSAPDGPDADILDILHPENVCVQDAWFRLNPNATVGRHLTWEGWRRMAREFRVEISEHPLEDYRYLGRLERGERTWSKRLRPIGQLLWGLLRHSFTLPATWNVRGQERSLLDAVAADLERLPISSFTLAILQACLLPRNHENSLLHVFPALFGDLGETASDDTEFDTPIETSEQLEKLLSASQKVLELSQMTVLEHEPRQLIPVRLRHLGAFGEEPAADQEID